MGNKCKYNGRCEYRSFEGNCSRGMACVHQTIITNTPNIRIGPDQDGLWYKTPNSNYSANKIQ